MIHKDLLTILKSHDAVFTKPPSHVPTNLVVDGPIIGNGDIGVVLSGQPEKQQFWISKCDFWKSKNWYPNGGVRALGGVSLCIDALKGATYKVTQSLLDASIRADFQAGDAHVAFTAWTAANDNYFIIEIKNRGCQIDIDSDLWVLEGNESIVTTGSCENEVHWISKKYDNKDLDWPVEGIIATKFTNVCKGKTHLKSGESAFIISYICTSFDKEECLAFSCEKVSKITHDGILSLKSSHEAWWQKYWEKAYILIDDKLIEKFWYGSHYIMACCSRNTNFPPGLFGNWITTDAPEWAGDYHLNYNYQAPWWGVYSSNRVEIAAPYDTPLIQYMNKARDNAKRLLDCRGLYYDVGIGPLGYNSSKMENDVQFWGQKSNAAYAAINMLMRFYHTYDLEYVRGNVYEFLKETALLWEDYLKFENGYYHIYNDAIHESSDSKLVNKNPILSLGLLKALFKGIIDISAALDMDEEKRLKWNHILSHLPAFPLQQRNGKTVFRYTEVGLDWWSDNTLGIQHIWPSGAIGLSSEDTLLEISKNTITELNRWADYNGFPTFFTAAARVGYDPEIILRKLHEQCETHGFPNLYIFYGGGGIECCSGVPSCINEMLLQSHEGIIRLFPVWPIKRNAKFNDLRAVGAFLVSCELVEGRVSPIIIKSEKGRECMVENPWKEDRIQVSLLEHDIKLPVAFNIIEEKITFKTVCDKIYIIETSEKI